MYTLYTVRPHKVEAREGLKTTDEAKFSLLTNFCKDLPHLLLLLFCYFARHVSVIDQGWSARGRCDCGENRDISEGLKPQEEASQTLFHYLQSSVQQKKNTRKTKLYLPDLHPNPPPS